MTNKKVFLALAFETVTAFFVYRVTQRFDHAFGSFKIINVFTFLLVETKTEITFPTGREILHAGISDFEAWAYCCLIRVVMSQVDEQNVKPF